MNLTKFLTITETRIPTVPEMVELCDELGIEFYMNGTQPVMKPPKECSEEAKVIASLFRREPFRSAVLEARKPTPYVIPKIVEGALPYDRIYDEDVPPDNKVSTNTEACRPMGAAIHFRYQEGVAEPVLWTWTGAKEWYPF